MAILAFVPIIIVITVFLATFVALGFLILRRTRSQASRFGYTSLGVYRTRFLGHTFRLRSLT
jgi:hypothetical protein